MNSVQKGDQLEDKIFNYFKDLIDSDQFLAKKSNCKIFQKKGYYSKDREGNIIFDVSIEIFFPDSDKYSILILLECKNYNSAVPVNDIEEFFAKIEQVGAANTKAIIASTNSFQSGTINYAKSKGIGLLKYFDPTNVDWELKRYSSQDSFINSYSSTESVKECLSNPNFRSKYFDLYMQSPSNHTNDLWVFIADLITETTLTRQEIASLINSKNRISIPVEFIEKSRLEKHSNRILKDIGYLSGEVSLEDICTLEKARSNLNVVVGMQAPNLEFQRNILGRILFESSEIQIFTSLNSNRSRERFTLAHELGHYFLKHGRYLIRESCDESDFSIFLSAIEDKNAISRLEFQANYFAANLLMPKNNFTNDFWKFADEIGLKNRGFGALYIDNQQCNRKDYMHITTRLMNYYGVSRTAIDVRLESLGLLLRDSNIDKFGDRRGYQW